MNITDVTAEQMQKIHEANSVAELAEIAKAVGIDATAEELEAAWNQFHESNDENALSDDELVNVAGGCGAEPPTGRTAPGGMNKCDNDKWDIGRGYNAVGDEYYGVCETCRYWYGAGNLCTHPKCSPDDKGAHGDAS